ncbi:MAG: hypothetical protein ACI4J4_07500, partial [Ruminiclostridium sp.]
LDPKKLVTTTTEAPPKEVPKIKDYSTFLKGCMTFKADGKYYALNLVDKKLYEYDKNTYFTAVAHNIALTGEGKIYNFATGEEYDGECLSNSSYLAHYNPVHKVEESFDGNVNYFGIIDWNGEWVLPLSSEYEICKNGLKRGDYGCSDTLITYMDKEYYNYVAYDFKNNKTYYPEDYGYSDILGIYGENIILYNSYYDCFSLAKYNTKSEELSIVFENTDNPYFNGSWCSHGTAYVNEEGTAVILDNDFNVVNHDLSEYKITKVLDATEDYVIFTSRNSNNDLYVVILKKDGSRVIEPIKCNEYSTAYIIGDYVIIKSLGIKDYVIDCKSGETKIYDDKKVYYIEKFDTASGMMLVKADGAYYLADPADPDTLINPLEYAQ